MDKTPTVGEETLRKTEAELREEHERKQAEG